MDLKKEDSGLVLDLDLKRDPRDELIEHLKEENANLQQQNDSNKEQISSMQQDSLAKEHLLKDVDQEALQKMAQLVSLSKIIEGKEEEIEQLNEENSKLHNLLKNIQTKIVYVEKVIQQTDKKNGTLEVEKSMKDRTMEMLREEVETKYDDMAYYSNYIVKLQIKERKAKEQTLKYKLRKLFSKKDRSCVYEFHEKERVRRKLPPLQPSFFTRLFRKASRNAVAPFQC